MASGDQPIGAEVEIVGLYGTLRCCLDAGHHSWAWHALSSEIPMDGLHAHADGVGKGRYRDFVVIQIRSELHAWELTIMVRHCQQSIPLSSPDWRWRDSPPWRQSAMSNRIKELRVAIGLTQHQLADAASTTFQQISRLENGERRLAENWMRRIAPVLGVRPADLLTDTAPNNGEFIQRPDEIALLRWWRLLVIDEKLMVAAMARAKGLEILTNQPKKRRS